MKLNCLSLSTKDLLLLFMIFTFPNKKHCFKGPVLSFGAPELICSCMDAFETTRDNLDVDGNLIDKTLYIINMFGSLAVSLIYTLF